MKQLIVVAVTAALMPFAVAAQSDDYESPGIRLGSFVARPAVSITQAYNSNLFRDKNNRKDSFITDFGFRGVLESDWNRHGLRLETGMNYGLYWSSSDDNFWDSSAVLSGVFDVKRNIRILASAGYAREHEARGTDDVDGNEKHPVELDDFTGALAVEAGFGRFRVNPFGELTHLNFHDVDAIGGGKVDQDDRDRLEGEAGLELGYAVRRGWEAFVRTSYLWENYDESSADRDSDGFLVLGGVKVDLTRLITASVGIGYEDINYDDRKDFSGFAYNAEVEWFITRRTTLFASGDRRSRATSITGASSYVDTRGSIGVTHEFLRNLNVSASASYTDRDFTGISRNDDLFTTRVGAEWRVNRRIAITPEYRFGMRDSNDTNDYNVHEVRLTGTLRF